MHKSGPLLLLLVVLALVGLLLLSSPVSAVGTPPTVTTGSADVYTAQINGNLSDLGTALTVDVGFHYGTDSVLVGASNTTVATKTAPGDFLYVVSGFTSGTVVYYRAWANGAANGFVVGVIRSFQLLKTTPAATNTIIPGLGVTPLTVSIGVTIVGISLFIGSLFIKGRFARWGTRVRIIGAVAIVAGVIGIFIFY